MNNLISDLGYVMHVSEWIWQTGHDSEKCITERRIIQSTDGRLSSKRNKGGRELKMFKEVYDETKTRVTCYMNAVTNGWVRIVWKNNSQKEQISLKYWERKLP